MARDLSLLDRLRIERTVWSLDQQLYDLPAGRGSPTDVTSGTTCERPRRTSGPPRPSAASVRVSAWRPTTSTPSSAPRRGRRGGPQGSSCSPASCCSPLCSTKPPLRSLTAFVAANPGATGSYRWSGIDFLQSPVDYRFADGSYSFTGGAWTPVAWAVWIVATILVGRLWRALPFWRRRYSPPSLEVAPATSG